jgi:hypothetical protein
LENLTVYSTVVWGTVWRSLGHGVAQFVEALRYKPEGRGFDSLWDRCDFSLT